MVASSYLRWLGKNKSIPSIRQMGVFSAAICVTTFMVFQSTLVGHVLVGRMLWFASAVILCTIVLMSSAASVVLTMREIRSGRRKLLRLANVGGKALIYGYLFNTLYHIRFLLVAAVGLGPIVVVGWAHYLAAGEWFQRCMVGVNSCQFTDTIFSPEQLTVPMLISTVLLLAIFSTILTNTAIGIWMALR